MSGLCQGLPVSTRTVTKLDGVRVVRRLVGHEGSADFVQRSWLRAQAHEQALSEALFPQQWQSGLCLNGRPVDSTNTSRIIRDCDL